MIREGEVTADGLHVDFKPEADAALFGIKTMPACVIKPAATHWAKGVRKDWKQIEFEIQGEGGDKELETIQRRIGSLGNWQTPVFAGEDNESGGLSFAGQNGGWGGGGRFNLQRQTTRIFPPEMLKPGAKVRIGVHAPLRNEALKFELELPELVQPR